MESFFSFKLPRFARYSNMSETKKVPQLIETSLAYVLSAVVALLGFLLVWVVCTLAGSYRS